MPVRVAVLLSGRGSNLQALIDAAQAPDSPAQIVLAISNVADAPGLQRARDAGIETLTVAHRSYDSREAFDQALDKALAAANTELVCLAGFMRILTASFVERWKGRLINIHPSLLPSFKGLNAQRQALEAGVKISGCSVHFVSPGTDEGPIIAQAAVPVLSSDNAGTLAARILVQEHTLYPLVVRLIAEGRVRLEGDRVLVDAAAPDSATLLNPCPQ